MRYFFLAIGFILAVAGALWLWAKQSRDVQVQFDPIIQEVTQVYPPADPLLIRAVIWRETRFNPRAVGEAKERGLMQVTPIAAGEWIKAQKITTFQLDDLFSPRTNIQAGTWYLSRSIRRWKDTDNPVVFALAEYNAGRSNALQWVDPNNPTSSAAFLQRVDFPTTKRYIQTILKKYAEYQEGYFRPPWQSYWDRLFRAKEAGTELLPQGGSLP
jgi:soluble lytic murein transglycosylase